eukprot:2268612-Pyramimonas_sp.AAC.1
MLGQLVELRSECCNLLGLSLELGGPRTRWLALPASTCTPTGSLVRGFRFVHNRSRRGSSTGALNP